MSGSAVGAKGLCAVINSTTMEVLPLIATDNSNDTATLQILICGVQSDGTITPILVDADGKIILSS